MRKMFSDEFRCLEVINLCGGERLGFPCEFELDLSCASVISFTVIPQSKGFHLFGDRDEYVIPWCKIDCIGEDAILVRITDNELRSCLKCSSKKRRKQL